MRTLSLGLLAVTVLLATFFLMSGSTWAQMDAETQQTQSLDNYGLDDYGMDDYDEEYKDLEPIPDPLEGWNRFWFEFNDGFYFNLWKPLAKGYAYVAPEPVRIGVKNFFNNLAFPVRFVNCLLQGEFLEAGVEMSSFIMNTTVGAAGLVDVAKTKKKIVEPDGEDLGQTLGVWGAGEGMFIVWPFLGPSTVRDTVGLVGDSFLNPLGYYPWDPAYAQYGVMGYDKLNDTSLSLGDYEAIKDAAIDPYVSFKQFFIEYRRKSLEQ